MESLQHITSLIADIPSWLLVLDEQNDQIGRRQAELARLSGASVDQTSAQRDASAPSLKNKGSTESLRPKANNRLDEEDEEAISSEKEDANHGAGLKRENNIPASNQLRPASSPQVQPVSTPRTPRVLQRKIPNTKKESPQNLVKTPTNPAPLMKRRKSKNSSLHSIHSSNSRNSQTATHPGRLKKSNRTRSMIIVYYDSAVQEAFEKLVRYISAARNTMRKGKMAERMVRMKMLAELEDASESSEEDNDEETISRASPANNQILEADDSGDNEDLGTPALKFKSTREMRPGAARTGAYKRAGAGGGSMDNSGNFRPAVTQTSSSPAFKMGMGIGNTRSTEPSIYDELDKILEWCQSTCEGAAHRFLRDGECYSEITGVKKRLEELVVRAKAEIVKIEEGEKEKGAKRGSGNQVRIRGGGLGSMKAMDTDLNQIKTRQLRDPLMRKTTPVRTLSSPTGLGSALEELAAKSTSAAVKTAGAGLGSDGEIEAGNDEDEDEGFSEDPEPPKLIFRSARAGGMMRR